MKSGHQKKRRKAAVNPSPPATALTRQGLQPRPPLPRGRWFLAASAVLVLAGVGAVIAIKQAGGRATEAKRSLQPLPAATGAGTPTSAAAKSGAGDDARQQAAALANRGSQLLARGDPAGAIPLYQQALGLAPNDEDLHYNLGVAYARTGKGGEAEKEYKEALRLYPDYPEVHNNLGNLLARLGRLDEAAEHLHAALSAMPDYAAAHNNLGTLLQRQGQTQEAASHFLKAVRLDTNYWEARFNLGNSQLAQHRAEEAIAQFEETLRFKPDDANAKEQLRRLGAPE